MIRILLMLITFLAAARAHAEYRAFELVITDSASGQERVVLSSLDPNQYRGYYPVRLTEKVTYRQTWRCRGNTSEFKAICAKPDQPAKPSAPSASQPT